MYLPDLLINTPNDNECADELKSPREFLGADICVKASVTHNKLIPVVGKYC